jgi:hypothetical protein
LTVMGGHPHLNYIEGLLGKPKCHPNRVFHIIIRINFSNKIWSAKFRCALMQDIT